MIGLVLLEAMATAAPIFGVQLGAPLSLPECSSDFSIPPAPCVLPGNKSGAPEVWFALPIGGSTPSFLRAIPQAGHMHIENGVVTSISLMTTGVDGQNDGLRYLSKAFGKPTSLTSELVRSSGGSDYRAVQAVWRQPNYVVTFNGAEGSTDHGEITIRLSTRGESQKLDGR